MVFLSLCVVFFSIRIDADFPSVFVFLDVVKPFHFASGEDRSKK